MPSLRVHIYDVRKGPQSEPIEEFVGEYDLDPNAVGFIRVIDYTDNKAYGEVVYVGSTNLVGAIVVNSGE